MEGSLVVRRHLLASLATVGGRAGLSKSFCPWVILSPAAVPPLVPLLLAQIYPHRQVEGDSARIAHPRCP